MVQIIAGRQFEILKNVLFKRVVYFSLLMQTIKICIIFQFLIFDSM